MNEDGAAVFRNTKTEEYLIHGFSSMPNGRSFHSPPFYRLSAESTPELIVQSILTALDSSKMDSSSKQEEEEATPERRFRELGLKKTSDLYINMKYIDVVRKAETISFSPMRNLGRRYLGITTDGKVVIPANCNFKVFYACMLAAFEIC